MLISLIFFIFNFHAGRPAAGREWKVEKGGKNFNCTFFLLFIFRSFVLHVYKNAKLSFCRWRIFLKHLSFNRATHLNQSQLIFAAYQILIKAFTTLILLSSWGMFIWYICMSNLRSYFNSKQSVVFLAYADAFFIGKGTYMPMHVTWLHREILWKFKFYRLMLCLVLRNYQGKKKKILKKMIFFVFDYTEKN